MDQPVKQIGIQDAKLYCKCMEDVKRRFEAIDLAASCAGPPAPLIEFTALQYRMIFELIILSAISSHRKEYERICKQFKKEWKVKAIVDQVKRINPSFYPEPVTLKPFKDYRANVSWAPVTDGFLTLSELVASHGRLGNILHASNQYKIPENYAAYSSMFKLWRKQICTLLNQHLIRLSPDVVFLIAMQGGKDDSVIFHEFKAV